MYIEQTNLKFKMSQMVESERERDLVIVVGGPGVAVMLEIIRKDTENKISNIVIQYKYLRSSSI